MSTRPSRGRRSNKVRLGCSMLLLVSLVSVLVFGAADEARAGGSPATITIEKTVVGEPAGGSFTFTVTPEVDGCTGEQIVAVDGAGGNTTVTVADAVAGPISFNQDDFTLTPVFGDVQTFDFFIDMTGIEAGGNYVNSPFVEIDYNVSGTLNGTPSGFPTFNLERTISFADFVNQSSDFVFNTDVGANLADGLQITDLFTIPPPGGSGIVLVIDAQEVGTGRYHPPILELRSDGTGRLQNSNNNGGINPVTTLEVDVGFGQEYITDLAFDPAVLTLAEGVQCTYTVTETPAVGYEATTATFSGISAGELVQFENTETPAICMGQPVTIDMRTNGGNGTGTAGDDVIQGTPGDDVITALAGNDLVCAGDGDDRVQGGLGDDVVLGQGGDDRIFGSRGADELHGGDGNDTLHGNRENDILFGDGGDDRIFGYAEDDEIHGGDGNDRLHGNFGNDTIDGDAGNDRIFGYGDDDVLRGGTGDDVIGGNFGDDIVLGNEGNDILYGSDGDDDVVGGPDDDIVDGNSGNDDVSGGLGDDALDGGINTDRCSGGPGIDTATRCETTTGVP